MLCIAGCSRPSPSDQRAAESSDTNIEELPRDEQRSSATGDEVLWTALVLARGISEPTHKMETYRVVALAYDRAGRHEKALGVAQELEPQRAQLTLLGEIANQRIQNNRVEEGLKLADQVFERAEKLPPRTDRLMSSYRPPSVQASVAYKLSRSLVDVGRDDEAMKMVERCFLGEELSIALLIAERHTKAKEYQQASQVLERALERVYDEPDHLINIAEAMIDAQQQDQALRLLDKAHRAALPGLRQGFDLDREEAEHNMGRIASIYARLGMMKKASRAAASVPASSETQLDIAEGFIDAGHPELALKHAGRLLESTKAHLYGRLALSSIEAGDNGQAKRWLAKVQRHLAREKELRYRVQILTDLMEESLGAGAEELSGEMQKQAIDTAQKIADGNTRDNQLGSVAIGLATHGRCDEALAATKLQKKASYTLARVAEQCSELDDQPALLESWPRLLWDDNRSDFLCAMSHHYAVAGELDRALEIAKDIPMRSHLAKALADIGAAFLKHGQPLSSKGQEIVRRIRERPWVER